MKPSRHLQPQCSKCGLDNDRAPQRYCSGCHMVYMRDWRKKQRSRETFLVDVTRIREALKVLEGQ